MAEKTVSIWQPSISDIISIFGLVAAAVMWLNQPNWEWGLSVTGVLVALVIFTAIRHQSHPIRRALISSGVIGILIWAATPPVWKSFHADYPNVVFQWPIAFDDDSDDDFSGPINSIPPPVIVPQPTIMPAPPGQRPLISSFARFIFSCDLSRQSASAAASQKTYLQKSLGPWGQQIGFDISIADVPGGFRVTINARTDEAKNRFLSLGVLPVVATIFIDVQRYGKETVVSAHADDLPKEFQNFSLMTPSASAPQIIEGQKQLGFFLGGNDKTCHII